MITQLTATEIAAKLRSKEVSATEVTQAFLDRIGAEDSKYGAFLAVDAEKALAQASEAQARLDSGNAAPLTGIPVAVKDNISTEGIETTCASKILKGYVPPYDATVVQKLKAAGAVTLGKTNLDEFAMGSSNENSAIKPARNPWDTARTPGGSSGGSAAAVAADLAPLSLGSDTGGSIRLPASFCGIVGFKPTYGRCSRYGLVAFASSLDQIGPLAKSVEDAALLANVITGHCGYDSTSIPADAIDISGLKSGSLKGLKLAFPKEMYGDDTDPEVRKATEEALDALRREGAEITEISIPTIPLGVTTYYIIAPAEASSNLARFDGVRYGPRSKGQGHIDVVAKTRAEGFGHEVKARIMIGTYALSAGYYDAFYLRAQQVRTVMTHQFNQAFREFDLVISPTAPVTAFEIGSLSKDPMQMKLLDYCTIPANMGGFPAISLQAGFAHDMPVGIQLMGPHMGDERVLQAAFAVERVFETQRKRPPIP
ncbi:MAG: Asp-tRNA(Asn)/Glu-tRNA(Gln) amidotransferase subunit GatA [Armatimonadetes bacterium]|nr:Asp-tRNA(Asn)/Glu-tRNA(Gln) amidotransferase subunit GatA [Armatimonadota bacterium]